MEIQLGSWRICSPSSRHPFRSNLSQPLRRSTRLPPPPVLSVSLSASSGATLAPMELPQRQHWSDWSLLAAG